jgi:hypothetical protein
MIDLKALAEGKFRITLDESAEVDPSREERPWYYRIPCKFGHIGLWTKTELSACAVGRVMPGKLMAIPGVRVVQRGDHEVQVAFPPDLLDEVATLLHARRKRRISDETRERLRVMGFKSATVEASADD